MNRERAAKIVAGLVGLLFSAGVYPLLMFLLHWWPEDESSLTMMLSIYVTLGIFLLLASRDPAANRSLIVFAAWANLAHAATMVVQSLHSAAERRHLLSGTALFGIIGIVLLVVVPAKPSRAQAE